MAPVSRICGYLRTALVSENRADVQRQLSDFAARYGRTIDKVVCEPEPAATTLWSVLEELDRRYQAGVVPAVTKFAGSMGMDLDGLRDDAGSTSAFWSLVGELDTEGGGCILVPSLEHLANVGNGHHTLLQRVLHVAPSIQVVTMDTEPGLPTVSTAAPAGPVPAGNIVRPMPAGTPTPAASPDTPAVAPVDAALLQAAAAAAATGEPHTGTATAPGIVCECQVAALGWAIEVVTVTAHMHLCRAGLSDLVGHVDALLRQLVGEAMQFDAETIPEVSNRLTIRLVRDPRALTILIHETRQHATEPISKEVLALCRWPHDGRAYRAQSPAGGCITCCELPLPASMALTSR